MHKIEKWNKWLVCLLTIFLLIILAGCQSTETKAPADSSSTSISIKDTDANRVQKDQPTNETGITIVRVEKGLSYSNKDEVAAYIHEFLELPLNYITKKEAQDLGWDNSKGNLWEVTNKKSIGGDRFGNREGLLPEADTRKYYECDINYDGGYRGSERIVYSNDGLVFYTDDHYETFEKLY